MTLRWLFDQLKSGTSDAPPSIQVDVSDEFVVVEKKESTESSHSTKAVKSHKEDISLKEEINFDDFEIIESHPAYSQPIRKLKYSTTDQGLRNSSHKIVKGVDTKSAEENFIKFNDNEAMLYAESFMNHLYSLSLLYGVGRCYVCYDDYGKPVALSSKEIPNFKTFKEAKLTAKQLADPDFRQRFLRILAVMFRMREDDAHSGNITIALEVFDADCGLWGATYKIKGGRPNVDNLGSLISRNPETAFALHEEDVRHFPNITHSKLWYYPSLDAIATSYFSNNPFTPEETKLVRELEKCDEALQIAAVEFLDWMLDISQRFPHLVALSIPKKCEHNGENLRELYCNENKKINEEYWQVLPYVSEFQDIIKKSHLDIAQEILIRCEIRNQRLENDKASHPHHDSEFDNAKLDPIHIIRQFNKLIKIVNEQQVLVFSYMPTQSIFFPEKKPDIQEISNEQLHEMQLRAKRIAKEMMSLESAHGILDWKQFSGARSQEESRLDKEKQNTVRKDKGKKIKEEDNEEDKDESKIRGHVSTIVYS